LNHEDVFILDTALKIFLFSGCNSTIQERAKGLEVVQYIKDNKHGGKCEVATIGWNIYYFSPLPFLALVSVFWGKDDSTHNNYTTIVEDGKFVGDSDVGEFWSLFGGYAPIPREPPSSQESVAPIVKLFWWGSYMFAQYFHECTFIW